MNVAAEPHRSVPLVADEEAGATGDRQRSRPSRARTVIVMAITGAAILGAAFLSQQPAGAPTATAGGSSQAVTLSQPLAASAPEVGKAAPLFTAITADGRQFSLAELRGKPVWLTFGASWCQACRAENPDIEAAFRKYEAKGLVVVQVYLAEDAAKVNDYADRVGLTYTRIPDPNDRLASEYRIVGIPTHFFIDRDGILRQLKITSLSPDQIEEDLAGIMR